MKTVKPTKNGWVAVHGMVEHIDDNLADICACDPRYFSQGHLQRSIDEVIANAYLIAAAPEMLEVLKRMVKHLSQYKNSENDGLFIDAQTVIENATYRRR